MKKKYWEYKFQNPYDKRFYETYLEDNPSSRDFGEIMIKEKEEERRVPIEVYYYERYAYGH